ncbi:hypothetical protein MASR1M46_12280 [Bacteroidales bacterium]
MFGISFAIKKSLGIARGKNDVVDAYRIAEYAYTTKKLVVQEAFPRPFAVTVIGNARVNGTPSVC